MLPLPLVSQLDLLDRSVDISIFLRVRHPEEHPPIFVGALSDWVDGGVVSPQPELLQLRLVRQGGCLRPPVLGAGLHAPPPVREHSVEHQPALGSPGDKRALYTHQSRHLVTCLTFGDRPLQCLYFPLLLPL